MPVIETETITRRKIVRGRTQTSNSAVVRVHHVDRHYINVSLSPNAPRGFDMEYADLREAASVFTEMADILEKGE